MGKCKYCYSEPNGDIPDDRKDLFRVPVLNTDDGRLYFAAMLGGGPYNQTMNLSVDPCGVYLKPVKIKYCPMCGRKLTGKDFVKEED